MPSSRLRPSSPTLPPAAQPGRDASLARRYGGGPGTAAPQDAPEWNEVLELLLARRSVRAYLDTPVTPAQLELIVAAAQSASSASNLQAWSVVAVQDPERKARISQLAGDQRHIVQAPLLLVFVADLSRLRLAGRHQEVVVDGLDYFESFLIGVVDAALAAQNATVAANSLGLGTCFIGALRNHPEKIADELALPAESFATFGLLVGHPDPQRASAVKPRLPAPAVLHRELYQPADVQTLRAYDATMRDFQLGQKMKATDWSRKSALRVTDAEALSNRDQLFAELRTRGFGLK